MWFLFLVLGIPFLIIEIKGTINEPKEKAQKEQRSRELLEKKLAFEKRTGFHYTEEVTQFFYLDEKNKLMYLFDYKNCDPSDNHLHKYSDLINFELIENGEKMTIEQHGQIGRAIIGGALFGVAGAVVGASTAPTTTSTKIDNMNINLYFASGKVENIFLCGPAEKSSPTYNKARREAERIIAILLSIKHNNN